MKQISLFIIGLLLFSGCGNKTSKQNSKDCSEPLYDIGSAKEIKIGEDVFYIEINDENYPDEHCLTIRDKQFDILLQQCYDYTMIEIREQENQQVLPLTFISGKHAIEMDFEYADGSWIAETIVYYSAGVEQPKKEITVNLKDFNFGDIIADPPPPLPPPVPVLDMEMPEHVKRQRQPRTTPARNITVDVSGANVTAEVFYYSPRMKNKDYSYRKELGSDNNFLSLISSNNKNMVLAIPDTCEQGAKLMFRSLEHEPVDVAIENICNENHIAIQFIPKAYNSTIVLKEEKIRMRQDSVSKITLTIFNESPTKVFYGNCLPIYGDDGISHGDPPCSGGFLSDNYPEFDLYGRTFFQYRRNDKYIGDDELDDELNDLYQALKEGEKCVFLITVDNWQLKGVEIEEFPDKPLEKFKAFMLTEEWTKSHKFRGYRFQNRIHFVVR